MTDAEWRDYERWLGEAANDDLAPRRGPVPLEVPSSWPEINYAGWVGWQRCFQNLERHNPDRNGDTGHFGVDECVLGAIGECGLAKHLNVFWSGNIGNYRAPDVAGYQVRGVSRKDHRVILNDWDKDEQVFVSALALRERLPIIILRGWIYAHEGKEDRYKTRNPGRGPCFMADPLILHDMRELPPSR